MLWANSTQTGFSSSTVPSPGRDVRPVRTMSARWCIGSCIAGLPRKWEMEATHAGERGSRKAALVGV